jgi:hypothetical protein
MAEEPLVTVARDPRQPRVKSFAKQRAARPLGPEVPRVEDRHALARPEDAPRPRTAGAEWAFNSGTDRGLSTRSHLESLAEYAEARVGVGPGSYDPSGPRAHEPVGQLLLMTSRGAFTRAAPPPSLRGAQRGPLAQRAPSSARPWPTAAAAWTLAPTRAT